MPLYSYSYISQAAEVIGGVRDTFSAQIIKSSRRNNAAVGISGILVHVDNYFIQVLEGSRAQINPTLHRIMNDTRHSNMQIVSARPITRRGFGDSDMMLFDICANENPLFRSYKVGTSFNPYEMPSDGIADMIDRIVEVGVKARTGRASTSRKAA